MSDLEPNTPVPTQVANPQRASWRTFVQSIIPTLIAVNAALPVIYQFLVENSSFIERVFGDKYLIILAVVNGAIAVLSYLSKLLARLMAVPGVNAWITKYLPFLAPVKP